MYSHEKRQSALGNYYNFIGPGLNDYDTAMFFQKLNDWATKCENKDPRGEYEADGMLKILEKAFKAGKAEAKKELREWLEVKQNV